MSPLARRLDRLQAELDARNMVKREPIVRQVPCWQDPQEYLDQMVASGEIAEAQREDVVLIQRVIVRPIHEFDHNGKIVGVLGGEIVPREELRQDMQRDRA
jgi:hypothetical protein